MTRFAAVNAFRKKRGKILSAKIEGMAEALGRNVDVLDVGGWTTYWGNVRTDRIGRMVLLNKSVAKEEPTLEGIDLELVEGDARNLSAYGDGAFDLVHSNSVIEHVGVWDDMLQMASEARRVGVNGWIQTPAFEFPIEPHFGRPFVHWLGQPIRRRLIGTPAYLGDTTIGGRRALIDRTNLLSRGEFRALFPTATIYVERFAWLPKSYVAHW